MLLLREEQVASFGCVGMKLFVPYCVGTICPRIKITSFGLLGDLKISMSCPLSRAYYKRPVTGTKFRRRSMRLTGHFSHLFRRCSCVMNPSTDYIMFIHSRCKRLLTGRPRHYTDRNGVCSVYRFVRSIIGPASLRTSFPRGIDVRGDYRKIHLVRLSSPDRLGVPCCGGLHSLLSLIGSVRIMRPREPSRYYKFKNVFTMRRRTMSKRVKHSGMGHRVSAKTRCVMNTSNSYLVRRGKVVTERGLPVGAVRVMRILTTKL